MILGLALALLMQAGGALEKIAPGTQYDPGIPTLKEVLGHDFGEEITPPEQITIYLKALAAAAPGRTRLIEYARTWEGRPLHALVVASPERISNLERVKADLRRLADPRGLSSGEAERLVRELPAVVSLMHAVHGNEISSSDAALAEAYHLLAARNDPAVDTILRESMILIDPLENPDGRARFVVQTLLGRAASPDAEPASAEHDEPWPGGRANHYLFDLNRDWFSQSQPETQGRTKLFLEWYPHVVVDLHEMGGDSTYYFAPPADPLNPHIPKEQSEWFDVFGRENAKKFDERGFAYFIREVFDSFYPGYGESWPIFHGSIGMTYEQASARGLVYRREDGALLTYLDGVVHHFTAAITTAHTAAKNREKLLRYFLEFRRSAVREGETGPEREILLLPGRDPSRADRLARLLAQQGIEVRQAEGAFKTGDQSIPAGSYVVSLAQPAGRLVRNLLDPHTPQPEEFVKEQDRRRKKRLGDEIYDITAWSLPLAYDVEIIALAKPIGVRTSPLGEERAARSTALPSAVVGYALPWGSGTAGAIVEALGKGIRVRSADRPFTLGGREYPLGTAIIRVSENDAELAGSLGAIVSKHGAEAVPLNSGFVEAGISLGSNQVVPLKPPRVLLAWDSPASSLSAGWARYTLERRFEQPVTIVRTGSLGRADLNRFDVLVLPSGNYSNAWNGDSLRRLKDWISAGGTLITLGEASRWAARESVGLLATTTELRDGRPDIEATEKERSKSEPSGKPIDLEKAVVPDRERPESTPGALLRVELDPEHWLSAGFDGEIQAIVEGQRVFTPLKLDKGRNVGVYSTRDRLVAGGLVWEEAQDLLTRKAYLMHQSSGRGHIVAFAEDPNYRAFTEATQLLFLNAVLLGPAH